MVSFPGAIEVLSRSPSGGFRFRGDVEDDDQTAGELLRASSFGMSMSSEARSLDASSERWSEAFDADDTDTSGTVSDRVRV